jgi:hypothetical protein
MIIFTEKKKRIKYIIFMKPKLSVKYEVIEWIDLKEN